MSAILTEELTMVLDHVKTWSVASRIALVKGVLETVVLDAPTPPTSAQGQSVEELIGLDAGTSPPPTPPPIPRGRSSAEIRRDFGTDKPAPDDETVKRWIDEHRMEKYG